MAGSRNTACRIPLVFVAGPAHGHGATEQLVAEFVAATAALSCQVASELAGVRRETLQKWRRRPPNWIKTATANRLRAHLQGERFPTAEEGFRKAFSRTLRLSSSRHRTPAARTIRQAAGSPGPVHPAISTTMDSD